MEAAISSEMPCIYKKMPGFPISRQAEGADAPPLLSDYYEGLEQISGGENPVFFAIDVDTAEKVLIKVYHPSVSRREVERIVNHTQAVRDYLREYGTEQGDSDLYLCIWNSDDIREFVVEQNIHVCQRLEYIEGESLGNFCKNAADRISFDAWIRMFERLVLVIYNMHKVGVAHNRLVPQSIFIGRESTLDDIDENFVLTNFVDSCARGETRRPHFNQMTAFRSREFIGYTEDNRAFVEWMSGLKRVELFAMLAREDVYCASMTMFNLASGQRLSEWQTSIELTKKLYQGDDLRKHLLQEVTPKALMRNFKQIMDKSGFSEIEKRNAKLIYKKVILSPCDSRDAWRYLNRKEYLAE